MSDSNKIMAKLDNVLYDVIVVYFYSHGMTDIKVKRSEFGDICIIFPNGDEYEYKYKYTNVINDNTMFTFD